MHTLLLLVTRYAIKRNYFRFYAFPKFAFNYIQCSYPIINFQQTSCTYKICASSYVYTRIPYANTRLIMYNSNVYFIKCFQCNDCATVDSNINIHQRSRVCGPSVEAIHFNNNDEMKILIFTVIYALLYLNSNSLLRLIK